MNKRTRNILLIIASILLVALGAYYLVDYSSREGQPSQQVVENQNQEQGSEDTENERNLPKAQNDLVVVDTPKKGEKVTSPLVVSGQVNGSWYSEGVFSIILTDWDGKIIAEANAQAQGDWMTEEFVPFEAELTFEKPELYDRGSLILQKANPSGLPENDAALEYTIYFE